MKDIEKLKDKLETLVDEIGDTEKLTKPEARKLMKSLRDIGETLEELGPVLEEIAEKVGEISEFQLIGGEAPEFSSFEIENLGGEASMLADNIESCLEDWGGYGTDKD